MKKIFDEKNQKASKEFFDELLKVQDKIEKLRQRKADAEKKKLELEKALDEAGDAFATTVNDEEVKAAKEKLEKIRGDIQDNNLVRRLDLGEVIRRELGGIDPDLEAEYDKERKEGVRIRTAKLAELRKQYEEDIKEVERQYNESKPAVCREFLRNLRQQSQR